MKRILSKITRRVRLLGSATPDPDSTVGSTKTHPAANALAHPVTTPELPGSQTVQDGNIRQLNAPLEDLPPEVRLQILYILDLEELRALVLASPVFHQQYILNRKSVLCKSLQTTLGSVTVDADAVRRCSSINFSYTRCRKQVTQFLEIYQERRASAPYAIQTEDLTEEQMVDMVVFHSRVVKPFARHYVKWASANLSEETKSSQPFNPLSKVEETRLMRALYRFQLACNLFGHHCHKYALPLFGDFDQADILNLFVCIYEPWEAEEIGCIYLFAEEKLDRIFDAISWDVCERNPKFEPNPYHEYGVDLYNELERDWFREGTLSNGLSLLHRVFFQIETHAHLAVVMLQHIHMISHGFLGDVFSDILGWMARHGHPTERLASRDLKQISRSPLPFRGDCGSDEDGLHPPVAWTIIWQGTYSNTYGWCIPKSIRLWGYALWDASRVEQTGAKEVLLRQWDAYWDDDDPRDSI